MSVSVRLKSFIKRRARALGYGDLFASPTGNSAPRPCAYLHTYATWLRSLGIRSVLDIGAHSGEFSTMAREVWPEAAIISFEPLPESFAKLKEAMRDAPGFTAHNLALGDENSHTVMFENEYSPSSSLLPMAELHKDAFDFARQETRVLTEVRRLDDLIDPLSLEPELFVKIDVQGFEEKVIRGGWNVVSCARLLVVEVSFWTLYEGQPLFDDIYHLLRSRGFKFAGSLEQLMDPRNGKILQADAAFLRD